MKDGQNMGQPSLLLFLGAASADIDARDMTEACRMIHSIIWSEGCIYIYIALSA